VDNVSITGGIIENSTSVALESIRDGNTASNGASLIDLLQHVVFSGEITELINTVDVVLVRYKAISVGMAILALVNRGTFNAIVMATSLIYGARLVCNLIFTHEIESTKGETTVTAVIVH
jgi:hypothetical protein